MKTRENKADAQNSAATENKQSTSEDGQATQIPILALAVLTILAENKSGYGLSLNSITTLFNKHYNIQAHRTQVNRMLGVLYQHKPPYVDSEVSSNKRRWWRISADGALFIAKVTENKTQSAPKRPSAWRRFSDQFGIFESDLNVLANSKNWSAITCAEMARVYLRWAELYKRRAATQEIIDGVSRCDESPFRQTGILN